MNELDLQFHHLGLACVDEAAACAFLAALGYEVGESRYEPDHRVRARFCRHETMPGVEVLSGGDEDSPLKSFLKQHRALVYHLCYECGELQDALDRMAEKKIAHTVLSGPTPSQTFGGRNVAFAYVEGMGLVELLESGAR